MKKILSSFVAMMMATVGFAQSSMLATLSHEGEISTFYGARALIEAYNAAANGDVITLSSGSFLGIDIQKGLTIRGAGMAIDATTQSEPTIITGDFTIEIPENVENRLTIEGIYHNHTIRYKGTFKNGTFIKDRFRVVNYSDDNSSVQNLTLINCFVSQKLYCYNNSSISCVNSVIVEPWCSNSSNSIFEFSNCIVSQYYTGNSIYNSSYKNCIVVGGSGSGNWFNSSNIIYNSVDVANEDGNVFREMQNTTNSHAGYADVFKTFTGTYGDSELFELTDEAKSAYLGLDGKEVGIYGGMMPYSSTPSNPQITSCNVASKSTADGKLSVDITVGSSD